MHLICTHCRYIYHSASFCIENCSDKDLLQYWLHQNNILYSFAILSIVFWPHQLHITLIKQTLMYMWDGTVVICNAEQRALLLSYNANHCGALGKILSCSTIITPVRSRDLMLVRVQTQYCLWRRLLVGIFFYEKTHTKVNVWRVCVL